MIHNESEIESRHGRLKRLYLTKVDSTNDYAMKILREKALNDNTPRAIQLPRLNLNGDLSHHEPDKLEDPGEPILIWLTKDVIYKEFGKFDTIRVPFYYQQVHQYKA
mgnify:CR=1 FL=1